MEGVEGTAALGRCHAQTLRNFAATPLRFTSPLARVAELADAQASGACVLRDVGVQVPPRAQQKRAHSPTHWWGCERFAPTWFP